MEVLDYVYLILQKHFKDVILSKPLTIKPIWLQKNPNVAFENYILLQDLSSTARNAAFGGEYSKQIAHIRCDVRTDNPRDLKILSRGILDAFKKSQYLEFKIDTSTNYSIDVVNEVDTIYDFSENISVVTLINEDPTILEGDTIKLVYPDGVVRYMYVWDVNGKILTLFGTEGIIYYAQVVGDTTLTDKRRGLYRRLIDVEVRAYL